MYSYIAKEYPNTFFPMTNELTKHICHLSENLKTENLPDEYVPIPKSQIQKTKIYLKKLLHALSKTNTGRIVLSATPADTYIAVVDSKKNEPLLGEAYLDEKLIVLNAQNKDNIPLILSTLTHELTHLIHNTIYQNITQTEKLNLYDEFCLKFLDETGANIFANKVYREHLNDPSYPISVKYTMRDKMYWYHHYSDLLWELSDYSKPSHHLTTKHSESYYKILNAYYDLHPELNWSDLHRHLAVGYRKLIRPIKSDLKKKPQEPCGKELVNRYYPIVRRLRINMCYFYDKNKLRNRS
ncbi:MAG: hypothetical protein IKJ28_03705 [Alphaproteobacteria bacterium]|nr:hypothetical protein [Alphaproteobacteria bacterium]